MKPLTQYQPQRGNEHGPTFDSMTACALWIIRQPDVALWFCALVRAPVCACEAERDESDLDDARDYWQPPFRADTGDLSGCGETAAERPRKPGVSPSSDYIADNFSTPFLLAQPIP